MIREVIFFTYGDSSDVSTWSNVPYLFSKTLEEKGIIVHRIDINVYAGWWMGQLWNRIIKPAINLIWSDNMFGYQRSLFANIQVNKIIKKAVSKHSIAFLSAFSR